MGTDDKIDGKADELKGKVKEGGAGRPTTATSRPRARDQAKGNLQQAAEKVKDVFKS